MNEKNQEALIDAYVLKSYSPCSESPDKSYHAIEILYEDSDKSIPYIIAGDRIKINIVGHDRLHPHKK